MRPGDYQLCHIGFVEKWKADLSSYPILRSYRLYKKEFVIESYLLYIKDYKLRKLLAKFRLSSHDLEIEKGRHVNPTIPEELRLCKLCSSCSVESEKHFLLTCSKYQTERVQLFCNLLKCKPDLFDNCNIDDVFKL